MTCLICNDHIAQEPSRVHVMTLDAQVCDCCIEAGQRDEQQLESVSCELCGKRTFASPKEGDFFLFFVCEDCLSAF
jgi:hypothetical protein